MQQHYKNVEVKRLYHVAESTVSSWIERARKGEIDLKLIEHGGRMFVANTADNRRVMELLVQQGKKYLNSRFHKAVEPSARFYELYSQTQVFDIITSLDIYHEIPLQYTYFDAGASHWDEYASYLSTKTQPNSINGAIKLLAWNQGYIDELLSAYPQVNVVDLGVGNCLSIRNLLSHLVDVKVLNRYIAVDISQDMLAIAEHNIKEWFGEDEVAFEGYVRDITDNRFDDLLIEDSFTNGKPAPLNLILFFGGTLTNLRQPDDALSVIRKSMGKNDVLLYCKRLDTDNTRQDLSLSTVGQEAETGLNELYRLPVDLLNLDESWYQVEKGFDDLAKERYIRIRLKYAISIKFEYGGRHRVVELKKNSAIEVYRAKHQSAEEVTNDYNRNGFEILQTSKTPDSEYLLVAARVKVGQ